MQIKVEGLASGKIISLNVDKSELNENLLNWLLSKSVTIASSCNGKGVCAKCVIQNDWKTCEFTLKEFLEREPQGLIKVSYL